MDSTDRTDDLPALLAELDIKKDEFNRLSKRYFQLNQDYMAKTKTLRVVKESIARFNDDYVESTTVAALGEAELKFKKEKLHTKALGTTQFSDVIHEDIEQRRQVLVKALEDFSQSRRNSKIKQTELQNVTDENRIKALNLSAFCKHATKATIAETQRKGHSAAWPSKRSIADAKANAADKSEILSKSMKEFYLLRVEELRRYEQILMNRQQDLMRYYNIQQSNAYGEIDTNELLTIALRASEADGNSFSTTSKVFQKMLYLDGVDNVEEKPKVGDTQSMLDAATMMHLRDNQPSRPIENSKKKRSINAMHRLSVSRRGSSPNHEYSGVDGHSGNYVPQHTDELQNHWKKPMGAYINRAHSPEKKNLGKMENIPDKNFLKRVVKEGKTIFDIDSCAALLDRLPFHNNALLMPEKAKSRKIFDTAYSDFILELSRLEGRHKEMKSIKEVAMAFIFD